MRMIAISAMLSFTRRWRRARMPTTTTRMMVSSGREILHRLQRENRDLLRQIANSERLIAETRKTIQTLAELKKRMLTK